MFFVMLFASYQGNDETFDVYTYFFWACRAGGWVIPLENFLEFFVDNNY